MPDAALTLELREVTCGPLRDVSVEFAPATFHALVGYDECGALLRVAGLLDAPEAGEVLVAGEATRALSGEERGRLRSRCFGFLFASPYLLPAMTVVENVAVPYFKLAGSGLDEARERTAEVLAFAGLAERGCDPVGDLGWCDQQRVALARALVHRPAFLIVDHASAPVPADEWASFSELLRGVPGRFSAAVIAAVPSSFGAAGNERVFTIEHGALREEGLAGLPHPESAAS